MRFRSVNSHHIKEQNHQHFLLEERNDPVTGDSFLEGDEVVFCSVCKSAFLKDSWVYMGNTHCNQKATLPIFPTTKKLKLQKPIELPFISVNHDDRSSAFFVDISALIVFFVILSTFFTLLDIKANKYFYAVLSFVLFTFRDSILINKSIGKKTQKMYFIDTKTNLPATIWQTLGRNLLYWVMNSFFALIITIAKALRNEFENAHIFALSIAVIVIIINFYYIKQNLEKNYSWFDELLGIQLVKRKIQ